jgi:acyl-CoA hydrolase
MAKIVTLSDVLDRINDNDHIVLGMAGAEPKATIQALHQVKKKDLMISNCLPMEHAEYIELSDEDSPFSIDSWFFGTSLRKNFHKGHIQYIPNHLHNAGKQRFEVKHVDLFVTATSMPDEHGYVSLSLSNVYEKRAMKAAKVVVFEINPNMPRTFGDVEVHINDVDYLVETNYLPAILPDNEPNELDIKIGKHIAALIPDGACLQLGIGGIPNAVASQLMHKKDLGIHTEMMTTGLMKLIKAGVATGKHKNTHAGKHVCCFALGTQELYDFIDNHPAIQVLDGNYVNDPYIIGLNDHQISINTTIEVDLTGQCASESIGTTHFSGTGGQTDTAVGAQNSKGGKSFISLYSTASVKVAGSNERHTISKIVPTLKIGAGVTLSRNDVDYVVTEYGIAHLKGLSIRERAKALIDIAHPDFKEELVIAAKELGYL